MSFIIRFLQIALFIAWSPVIRADWINLTGAEIAPNIAEIYFLNDHIKVNLEVYAADLDKFSDLLPDDWIKDKDRKRPSLEQRMQAFATYGLQFVTENGTHLPAKLKLVEPRLRVDRKSAYAGMINPTNRQRINNVPVDKRVLYAEIIYSFIGKENKLRPEQIHIIPPLDAQGNVTATIGFVAYHLDVPIIDFRYLGQPEKLNLNWQDPWYSKFDNKNLTRHHKYPLMLYLYVEPRQVRLESLLRINDISEMTGFDMDKIQFNTADKYKKLQEHIKNYYAGKGGFLIDAKSFKPDSIRVEFLTISLTGIKVIENASLVDHSSLLIGVSQQFLINKMPQKIESSWKYFNQRVTRIPVVVTDPAGPLPSYIDKDNSNFGWQNYLKKYSTPVIRPVNVKTGWSINIPYIGNKKIINQIPDQQQATSIVHGVFENVRIAFIEKDPDNISRELARVSVKGMSTKQVDIVKKELAKLFSPYVSGGVLSSLESFDNLHVSNIRDLEDSTGFITNISGIANISAKHWGHIDQRQFQFQLLLDLTEINKQWRLVDLTVIDMKEAK